MLVSSLSKHHANKGASYVDSLGSSVNKPSIEPLWPFGPGDATVGAWDDVNIASFFGSYLSDTDPSSSTAGVTHKIWPPYGLLNNTGSPVINYKLPLLGNLGSDMVAPPLSAAGDPTAVAVNKSILDWPSYIIDYYNPYQINQLTPGTYEVIISTIPQILQLRLPTLVTRVLTKIEL